MGPFKSEFPVLTTAVRTKPFLSGNVSVTLSRHHLPLGSTSLTSKIKSSCLMFVGVETTFVSVVDLANILQQNVAKIDPTNI